MASQAAQEKTFIERDLDFYEAVTCVFNFKEHELVVYMDLCGNPRSTVDGMAQRLSRDRSWVHRALSTLLHLGMVRRYRKILAKGGHIYQYETVPPETARGMLRGSLERWCSGMAEQIEKNLTECLPGRAPPEQDA